MAKRVLIAQGVLVGAAVLGMFVKEVPGLIREIRMWRMASFRSGSANQKPRSA
ncbi:hypothetical protein DFQ14_104230 [Halopolyspora algeriensis]|uniref:Uncharacterized protein n=1 Tax=Halopolyspora algeriensis TaxID=1500506 RepID=A0A368VSC4_9ACTN|nr:hypothetical protein DFQ14_104230 [Halopolyspora algeriensis]TQM56002.1 hypothetical protein FHU43_0780 [Halopolyspora algeriensis]